MTFFFSGDNIHPLIIWVKKIIPLLMHSFYHMSAIFLLNISIVVHFSWQSKNMWHFFFAIFFLFLSQNSSRYARLKKQQRSYVELFERLPSLGIMGDRFRASWNPSDHHNTIVLMNITLSVHHNRWTLIIPRDARLSDNATWWFGKEIKGNQEKVRPIKRTAAEMWFEACADFSPQDSSPYKNMLVSVRSN